MRVWMLSGLIALTFGCTAQHEDKPAADDPAATDDSHGENKPDEACRQLVARVNEAGGRDNITAVVADFHIATNWRCSP